MFAHIKNWRHSRAGSEASLDVPERRSRRSSRTPSPNPSRSGREPVPAFPQPQPQPATYQSQQAQYQPQPALYQPQPTLYQPQPTPYQPQPQPQPQPDGDEVMVDVSPPPNHYRGPIPKINAPTPQSYGSNFSTRSRSPSGLPPPDNESQALMALSTQCALSLALVAAELAPIPCIGVLVGSLTIVFQAVEKTRVN
ncbi:hypothetical protein FRC10_006575, partial [Ceratobasidium sp. 414]